MEYLLEFCRVQGLRLDEVHTSLQAFADEALLHMPRHSNNYRLILITPLTLSLQTVPLLLCLEEGAGVSGELDAVHFWHLNVSQYQTVLNTENISTIDICKGIFGGDCEIHPLVHIDTQCVEDYFEACKAKLFVIDN